MNSIVVPTSTTIQIGFRIKNPSVASLTHTVNFYSIYYSETNYALVATGTASYTITLLIGSKQPITSSNLYPLYANLLENSPITFNTQITQTPDASYTLRVKAVSGDAITGTLVCRIRKFKTNTSFTDATYPCSLSSAEV